MNLQILVGRLGQDPELKHTQSGKAVIRLSVATDHSYKHASGNWQTNTTWHSVIVWEKRAEFCAKWFKKGTLVSVTGRTEKRKYTPEGGIEREIVEVIAENIEAKAGMRTKEEVEGTAQAAATASNPSVDEIPF